MHLQTKHISTEKCMIWLFSDALRFRCDYRYTPLGWFKYHEIPATWKEARLQCKFEGETNYEHSENNFFIFTDKWNSYRFFFFFVCPCVNSSSLPDGKHKQDIRVVFTILVAKADNATT